MSMHILFLPRVFVFPLMRHKIEFEIEFFMSPKFRNATDCVIAENRKFRN